jgi:hypothetical protein
MGLLYLLPVISTIIAVYSENGLKLTRRPTPSLPSDSERYVT